MYDRVMERGIFSIKRGIFVIGRGYVCLFGLSSGVLAVKRVTQARTSIYKCRVVQVYF